MLRRRRIVLVVLSAGLALSSCGTRSRVAAEAPAFHPGEADPARSLEAREEVRACTEDEGWHLGNLQILVDAEGLLIRIAYRSRNIFPGTLEREVVDSCLTEAGVTQPPEA